ncbi:hypothetical protein [Mycolicibacterium mucogenicum]|uniref:Uncharacterized protein n=1 Tax=Mycolicibacterium mucogenicum DSM 44124 TaxID=1226753 RepID=A0A8E4R7B2_MYCMU|nr:hypothetical protein [Mycolicibacterium mucogenicum]KAB7752901.1 hypothetical protein MMUC44124_26650 [Mycolicibacterium mucogenicum DSM 44124]QPG69119.1 hypothetical protein C1S78_027660 [Mycolicibacterium mucogenicum DSM 44124]
MGSNLGIEYETADGATVVIVVPEATVERTQRGTSVYLADVLGGGAGASATICGRDQDKFIALLVRLIGMAVSA